MRVACDSGGKWTNPTPSHEPGHCSCDEFCLHRARAHGAWWVIAALSDCGDDVHWVRQPRDSRRVTLSSLALWGSQRLVGYGSAILSSHVPHHNTMADQNVSKLGIASATLKASTRLHRLLISQASTNISNSGLCPATLRHITLQRREWLQHVLQGHHVCHVPHQPGKSRPCPRSLHERRVLDTYLHPACREVQVRTKQHQAPQWDTGALAGYQ
jgi:hypothetical protein